MSQPRCTEAGTKLQAEIGSDDENWIYIHTRISNFDLPWYKIGVIQT